jgi:probable HAF family extracellular repeat protein
MLERMQKTWSRSTAVGAIAGASLLATPAVAITFTQLGDIPGGDFNSSAYAISNDGTTVVGSGSAVLDFEAFRWTQATGLVPLADLVGGALESGANAVAVSGLTTVIAGYGNTATASEAASWSSPLYAPTSLGTLGGANPGSVANGISANGTVIVGRTTTPAGNEAFMWTSGGGMVSLGDFPTGGTDSTANDVSDDGTVIVGGGLHLGPVGEAFRWTSGSGLVGLGDLAGGTTDSVALGVSGDGDTVVGESVSANGIEAFVWTVGSGMLPLGDLAGGIYESRAYDASSDGSLIVGSSEAADSVRAVVWSGGALFDLNAIAASVLPAGWLLEEAFGISSDGLAIVGRANNPDGNNEAFLLRFDNLAQIPEPGTSSLLGLGLVALAAARRR